MTTKKLANDVDIHVGGRLRMRRLMLGVSQEKLADGLGITFQQVQKYEKGVNRISASRLQQIAQILETHISYFFDGQGKSTATFANPTIMSDFVAVPGGLNLARAFMSITSADVRKSIVKLVESVAVKSGTLAASLRPQAKQQGRTKKKPGSEPG